LTDDGIKFYYYRCVSKTNGRLHDSSLKSQTLFRSQTDVKPSIQMLVWSGKFQIVWYEGLRSGLRFLVQTGIRPVGKIYRIANNWQLMSHQVKHTYMFAKVWAIGVDVIPKLNATIIYCFNLSIRPCVKHFKNSRTI